MNENNVTGILLYSHKSSRFIVRIFHCRKPDADGDDVAEIDGVHDVCRCFRWHGNFHHSGLPTQHELGVSLSVTSF